MVSYLSWLVQLPTAAHAAGRAYVQRPGRYQPSVFTGATGAQRPLLRARSAVRRAADRRHAGHVSAAFVGQPAHHLRHLVDIRQHSVYCGGLPPARSALAIYYADTAVDDHTADVHGGCRFYGRVPGPAGGGALAG